MTKVNFITTPTSGSQSILRLISEYCSKENGELKLYRGNEVSSFPGYKDNEIYIINFRDPRDIWCNQYQWLIQHPTNVEDPVKDAEIRRHRKNRYDLGVDNSVIKSLKSFLEGNDHSLNFILDSIKSTQQHNVFYVSYCQLCLKYDYLINTLNQIFGLELSLENNSVVRNESPGGLDSNPNWIGNEWFGCDIKPGRFRNELSPKSIDTLNCSLKDVLGTLASVEPMELRWLYE